MAWIGKDGKDGSDGSEATARLASLNSAGVRIPDLPQRKFFTVSIDTAGLSPNELVRTNEYWDTVQQYGMLDTSTKVGDTTVLTVSARDQGEAQSLIDADPVIRQRAKLKPLTF